MKPLPELLALPISERCTRCSPFVRQVVELACSMLDPEWIAVFGSRARGQERQFSDYDFAIAGTRHAENWAPFVLHLEEEAETLLPFDLVCYEDARPGLRQVIETEGVRLYERQK